MSKAFYFNEKVNDWIPIEGNGEYDKKVKVGYYYGSIASEDGHLIENTTAYQRTTGTPIDCLNGELKIKVPAVSSFYGDTSDSIRLQIYAYDKDNKYITGVNKEGKVLPNPGQFGGAIAIKKGGEFLVEAGYKYKFVNENSWPNPYTSNEAALDFLKNDLEVYVHYSV